MPIESGMRPTNGRLITDSSNKAAQQSIVEPPYNGSYGEESTPVSRRARIPTRLAFVDAGRSATGAT
jgi:hypothetical protein